MQFRDGLASLDKAPDSVNVDDLAPVDELHIGGFKASEDFSTNSGSVRISMFSMLDAALADLRDLSRSMAMTADLSAVAEADRYRKALERAGFAITAERNRCDFALAFFANLRAKTAAADG